MPRMSKGSWCTELVSGSRMECVTCLAWCLEARFKKEEEELLPSSAHWQRAWTCAPFASCNAMPEFFLNLAKLRKGRLVPWFEKMLQLMHLTSQEGFMFMLVHRDRLTIQPSHVQEIKFTLVSVE